jgi:hypothetical protein
VCPLQAFHEAERRQPHAKIGVVHGQGILTCAAIRTRGSPMHYDLLVARHVRDTDPVDDTQPCLVHSW